MVILTFSVIIIAVDADHNNIITLPIIIILESFKRTVKFMFLLAVKKKVGKRSR